MTTLETLAPVAANGMFTVAWLMIAVPAVVAYNIFSARIREFAARCDDFCRELLNALDRVASAAA